MTWSYSGDPASSDKDAARFHAGDTETTDQLATDEEFNFALLDQPDPRLAAAVVLEALAARFSRQADKRVGQISEQLSQRAEAFAARAKDLRRLASSKALPVFGGLSISEKDSLDQDTDAVQPSFRIGQFDNPEIPNEREHSDFDTRFHR